MLLTSVPAIIIVVYGEKFYETDAFISVIKSLQFSKITEYKIYIYDNTDKENWQINFDQMPNKERIFYVHNPNNPGISVAYNYIAQKALEDNMQWILLMDQDTKLPDDALSNYQKAIKKNPQVKIKIPVLYVRNKIFSPFRLFLQRAIHLNHIAPGNYDLKKFDFVNSGMLVHLPLFFKAGGYNENIKLDFADFQFIERARVVTDQFEILPIKCEHDFSHHETDRGKALKRYAIYVHDMHQCKTNRFIDQLGYFVAGTAHLLKLSMKFRSFDFLKVYFNAQENKKQKD